MPIAETSGFRAAVPQGEDEGRPVASKHGPIDAQVSAALLSGHGCDCSSRPELLEGIEAPLPMGMSDAIAPSVQPLKAVASPGIRVIVESARSRSARSRRIR